MRMAMQTEARSDSTQPSVFVRAGRLESYGNGWAVRVPQKNGDFLMIGSDGDGLTKDEAEIALDRLDNFIAERQ